MLYKTRKNHLILSKCLPNNNPEGIGAFALPQDKKLNDIGTACTKGEEN